MPVSASNTSTEFKWPPWYPPNTASLGGHSQITLNIKGEGGAGGILGSIQKPRSQLGGGRGSAKIRSKPKCHVSLEGFFKKATIGYKGERGGSKLSNKWSRSLWMPISQMPALRRTRGWRNGQSLKILSIYLVCEWLPIVCIRTKN